MYIHQATKKAVKENKMMYRKNVMQIHGKIIIGILPTDSYVTCLIAKIKDVMKKQRLKIKQETIWWQRIGN